VFGGYNTLAPNALALAFWGTNIIGITFARSLHYQFYSWYFYSIPFLLSLMKRPWMGLVVFVGLEYVFMQFPPAAINSATMLCCHIVLLLLVYFRGPTIRGIEQKPKQRIKRE
jgi:alpha-1,3-mannosyltransferase